MSDPYAVFGRGYAAQRRPDPRIGAVLEQALGGARTVVNVGAGTGSYEPAGRAVTAVEPSAVMIAQRPAGSAPVVRAYAENLPFPDGCFDAAMAVLTVHHWTDPAAGLAELRRVSRRQAILTWDPEVTARFWLIADYLPEIATMEAGATAYPQIRAELERTGAAVRTVVVPVPADCTDGFLAAHWRRPESYLDPAVRAAVSSLVRLDPARVGAAMDRLAADLASGRWHERHPELAAADTYDGGYRLLVVEAG